MYARLLIIAIALIGLCSSQGSDLLRSVFNLTAGQPTARPVIINFSAVKSTHITVTVRSPVTPPPVSRESGHSYKPCGKGKVCVRQYLCSTGEIADDGSTVIDIRFNGADVCSFMETCCSTGEIVDSPKIRPVFVQTGCGYRNCNGVGNKVKESADREAEFGEFPWMVGIIREEKALGKILSMYKCGGSLITPQVVLTAAHCISEEQAGNIKVRAGEWETNTKNELFPDQEREAVEMIVHEHFKPRSLHNDIALLFVDSPFDIAPNVNTVCLPPADYNFDYSQCFATGWGKNHFEKGDYQNILKKIDLPIVPHDECQTKLRETRLSRYFRLHDTFICAGGERGKDMCTGDGGAPLVCPIRTQPNRYYQAGIVAWGLGCGLEDVPGVYASVPKLREWIDKQLGHRQIEPSYFTS